MVRSRPPSAEGTSSASISYRIIAGELKGKTITVPDLDVTRPPLTRVRRSIADFLMPYLPGARLLDLFSGTGSYLFELLSRGAVDATGVERESRLAAAINQSAELLGVSARLRCRCDDVLKALPAFGTSGASFDVVMIAPPQYRGILTQTLQAARSAKIAGRDSLWLLQHDPSERREIELDGWRLLQERHYGNTMFTIIAPH